MTARPPDEKPVRTRLDTLLTERGLAPSRHLAKALIMAGKVTVDGERVEKPGKEVSSLADVSVQEHMPYVSRGGFKLKGALDAFGIDPAGMVVLDAGASTGGFTDCLLQAGAAAVIAVDVGYGQLHWTLRNHPAVTVLERRNIRFMDKADLPAAIDAAVADLSFISLKLILPKLAEMVPPRGWVVTLVKPQFEVGRADVGKGGVVRDPEKMRRAVEEVKAAAERSGFRVLGEVESPIQGPKGNREFLLHLKRIPPEETS